MPGDAAAPASESAADAGMPAGGAVAAGADSTRHHSRPFGVMLRSAVVPGWGQMHNRKFVKAVAVLAGEGFLAYKAWREFEKERDALDRYYEAYQASLDRGDAYPNLDPAVLAADDDRKGHLNRKINWIWWGVAAHVFGMVDAYVDAHLITFEADFGPPEPGSPRAGGASGETGGSLEGGPRLALALRTRF